MKEITIEDLEVHELEIPEIKIFKTERKIDKRGYVLPVYNQKYLLSIGINDSFVHENHCWSEKRATIRGFHYQLPPYGQSKLIRVTKGKDSAAKAIHSRQRRCFGADRSSLVPVRMK